jgi:Sec-independent protein translocase protein TatA
VLLIVLRLLIFGAKRLPEMERSLVRGTRELKDGVTGRTDVSLTDARVRNHQRYRFHEHGDRAILDLKAP